MRSHYIGLTVTLSFQSTTAIHPFSYSPSAPSEFLSSWIQQTDVKSGPLKSIEETQVSLWAKMIRCQRDRLRVGWSEGRGVQNGTVETVGSIGCRSMRPAYTGIEI